MIFFYFSISIFVLFAAFMAGLFLFLKPVLAIELQRRFYALINWRIEPISMEKEIRNMKMAGLALAVMSAMAAFYLARG